MRLHCDMRIQMVESAIGFFTAIPSALVHALNFFITPARSLVLLCTRDRDEGINCGKWVTALDA